MRKISMCVAIAAVMVVIGVCANAAVGPQNPAQPKAQAQEDKAFQGTLVMVDAEKHMLTVKAADDKEWFFSYTDDTKVIGPAKDVEGLTGKPGANLKITYHIEGLANRATRIEVLP
jgi:hypothetical protein